jgi:hypothetical protein
LWFDSTRRVPPPEIAQGNGGFGLYVAGDTTAELKVDRGPGVYALAVAPGYLDVFGRRILAGRGLSKADTANGESVGVVSAWLASKFWPDGTVVGRTLQLGKHGRAFRVVGVVEDLPLTGVSGVDGLEHPVPEIYFSDAQVFAGGGSLVVVSRGDSTETTAAVRRAVTAVRRDGSPGRVMSDLALVRLRALPLFLLGSILTGMAIVGVVLSVVGTYGLIAFLTAQRTREIGIHMAVGATPGDVTRLVLRGGIAMTVKGLIGGAILSLLVSLLARPVLFRSNEPLWIANLIAIVLLALAAGIASWIPAIRAARTTPLDVLRSA